MQFSEAWLREWIDPDLDTAQLTHLLTMSGLEVESCEPVAPRWSKIVVCTISAFWCVSFGRRPLMSPRQASAVRS